MSGDGVLKQTPECIYKEACKREGHCDGKLCVVPADDPTNDPINPSYYKGDYVMRIIEDFHLDFLDGQVVKYILRSGQKPGESYLKDYKKALWYLQRKIANEEKEQAGGEAGSGSPPMRSGD